MAFYSIEQGYKKSRRWRHPLTLLALAAIITVAGFFRLHKFDTHINASKPIENSEPTAIKEARLNTPVEWPKYGQAAYGVEGNGVLAASNDGAESVPVASLAKVITALAVLKQKPLQPGEQGPMITLSDADIKSYEAYVAKSGAVVPIEAGEQISEYQALQAMLMPSANNMADTLARWAFGSIDNYNTFANKMVKDMGISKTVVSDASGFSPSTKSTAHDMVKLGIEYMQNPVLREIASQKEAKIPFAGVIQNYNSVINKDGLLGLKVGDTDEAGRCFLVADIRNDQKKTVSVVAVIGADHLETAMKDAKLVLGSGNSGYDLLGASTP